MYDIEILGNTTPYKIEMLKFMEHLGVNMLPKAMYVNFYYKNWLDMVFAIVLVHPCAIYHYRCGHDTSSLMVHFINL